MVKDYKIDKMLIVVTALLVLFGLIMVYSSTMILAKDKYGDSFYFLKKQGLWMMLGVLIASIIASFKYPVYLNKHVVMVLLGITIAGLLGVFVVGRINNSYRWIRFAGFSLQPSEFAKIATVLYLSYIFSSEKFDVNDIRKLLIHLTPFFIIELLILKEPDLGNFMLILLVTMMMLFMAGMKARYFGYSFLFLIPTFLVIIKLNPDKMNRILAFLTPDAYVDTINFQALQSVYAVGSGGIFGKGLGNSTQKLFFLPYAYSDFIFAIIGEEVGLVGALGVIALFVIFMIRGFNVAKVSGSRHTYLLVTGLTFMMVIQAMINISVTIGIFPTKGIPLPFISNGGTSLISSLIVVGIILNVSRQRKTVFLND